MALLTGSWVHKAYVGQALTARLNVRVAKKSLMSSALRTHFRSTRFARMKVTSLKTSGRILAGALVCAVLTVARAAEPTAFELIKEGNRYVAEKAKDKTVQIRS